MTANTIRFKVLLAGNVLFLLVTLQSFHNGHGTRRRQKRNLYGMVETIVICHKQTLSLAGPGPNIGSLSWQTWCYITSRVMSCWNLPAWKSETASWSRGKQGTTGPATSNDPECSQCWAVVPACRWWVENRGKKRAGGILEEHSSKHGYTTRINWENVWAPDVR